MSILIYKHNDNLERLTLNDRLRLIFSNNAFSFVVFEHRGKGERVFY